MSREGYGFTHTWPNWCEEHKREYEYGGECPACAGKKAADRVFEVFKKTLNEKLTSRGAGDE